jgi:hypothetical protein
MITEQEKQYKHETYYWLKEHKCCVSCKKQDARTLIGRIHCFECAEKNKRHHNNAYQENPDKYVKQSQRAREKRREQGECAYCGRPYTGKYKACDYCRAKERRKYHKKQRMPGECSRCGSPLDGQLTVMGFQSKLCSKCYQSVVSKCRDTWKNSRTISLPFISTENAIKGYHEAVSKAIERLKAGELKAVRVETLGGWRTYTNEQ